jgi:hypothetical protein
MLTHITELGSLKSGYRALAVIEYDALLLPFSFSEMTMALLIGGALDLLDMFLYNQICSSKNANKIPKIWQHRLPSLVNNIK